MVKIGRLKLLFTFLIVIALTSFITYQFYSATPKNSLKLYEDIHFADSFEEVKKHILEGYEEFFHEKDFNYMRANKVKMIGQFTLFEYEDQSYVVSTSPGTRKLHILEVIRLPHEIREFFLDYSIASNPERYGE